MAKILIYAGGTVSQNFSAIAPMRIAMTCKRHGDEIVIIEWANDLLLSQNLIKTNKTIINGIEIYTLPPDQMLKQLESIINTWKPNLIYSMGYTHLFQLITASKTHSIPIGLLVLDPYYAYYPDSGLLDFYKLCDFITFNEGQAWNYICSTIPTIAYKCFLLNHAIAPELAPSWEEIQKITKKYICSIVGGDDRLRRRELLLYFYQWTDKFPNQKFATGGSLTKGVIESYKSEDLNSSIAEKGKWNHTTFTNEEVEKFKDKKFNLIHISNNLPYPLGLSHPAVHKLYSESYYGFTPYGYYLRKDWQSEFNTMTFGTKIFEQGGSGCAMVANRIKDIEMIIKHGETGFILEKPEDSYEVFKLAIEKPKEARQMGLRAYQFIHHYHSWDARYESVLLKIFQKLGVKK